MTDIYELISTMIFLLPPILAVGAFVVSLIMYISARRANKRDCQSYSPDQIRIRRTVLIITSVILAVVTLIVISIITLLYLAIAYM